MTLYVDFNIDTINLAENGNFTIRTQVEFQGLFLYDDNTLPTLATVENKLEIISAFIDTNAYHHELVPYEDSDLPWQHLTPLA